MLCQIRITEVTEKNTFFSTIELRGRKCSLNCSAQKHNLQNLPSNKGMLQNSECAKLTDCSSLLVVVFLH